MSSAELSPARGFTGRIMVRLTDRVQERLSAYYAKPAAAYIAGIGQLADVGETHWLRTLIESLAVEARPLVREEHVAVVRKLEASAVHSRFPPLRSLLSYLIVDTRSVVARLSIHEVVAMFAAPGGESEVDFVVPEHRLTVAGPVTPDDDLVGQQGYLDGINSSPPKPFTGINVHNALVWGQYDGSNVGFVDIELGWAPHHDDLPPIRIFWPSASAAQSEQHHGTRALGIVLAKDSPIVGGSAEGIVGIAPACTLIGCATFVAPGNPWDLSGAMLAASTEMQAGDVLLLECQTDEAREIHVDELPVEVEPAWLDTIRLLVANDIVVVEAAGNASINLDHDPSCWMKNGLPRPPHDLNRASGTTFVDSGAIMVSGCASVVTGGAHVRTGNHGSRIDCHAWSNKVLSTYWVKGSSVFNSYKDFYATSAASAIIAGAAVLVQHMSKTTLGTYLQPAQLRALLGDWTLGTPIVSLAGGPQIGVMPDLVMVGQQLGALPDIYVRDSLADTGEIPTAMLSQSPDIIVKSARSLDAEGDFGRTGMFADDYIANDLVVANAANHVYVRILNRNKQGAIGASATVYWAHLSPLILPEDWHFVGTSPTVSVPGVANPGDPHPMVVVELPAWTPAPSELPPGGHACFIAVLHAGLDPAPAFFATRPAISSITDAEIADALGRYNNAAYRNFTVHSVSMASNSTSSSGDADGWASYRPIPFFARGLKSRGVITGFTLEHDAPPGVEFRVELPGGLTNQLEFANCELKRDNRGRAIIDLDYERRRVDFRDVPIRAGDRHECMLLTRIPHDVCQATWHLLIRQHIGGRWVGALTFEFGTKGR